MAGIESYKKQYTHISISANMLRIIVYANYPIPAKNEKHILKDKSVV